MKKCRVRVQILKPDKSENVNFAPGEIVWVTQEFADEPILADGAENPEEEIDIEIERNMRENPEAVKRMIAKADADLAAGRCGPGGFAIDE